MSYYNITGIIATVAWEDVLLHRPRRYPTEVAKLWAPISVKTLTAMQACGQDGPTAICAGDLPKGGGRTLHHDELIEHPRVIALRFEWSEPPR